MKNKYCTYNGATNSNFSLTFSSNLCIFRNQHFNRVSVYFLTHNWPRETPDVGKVLKKAFLWQLSLYTSLSASLPLFLLPSPSFLFLFFSLYLSFSIYPSISVRSNVKNTRMRERKNPKSSRRICRNF